MSPPAPARDRRRVYAVTFERRQIGRVLVAAHSAPEAAELAHAEGADEWRDVYGTTAIVDVAEEES